MSVIYSAIRKLQHQQTAKQSVPVHNRPFDHHYVGQEARVGWWKYGLIGGLLIAGGGGTVLLLQGYLQSIPMAVPMLTVKEIAPPIIQPESSLVMAGPLRPKPTVPPYIQQWSSSVDQENQKVNTFSSSDTRVIAAPVVLSSVERRRVPIEIKPVERKRVPIEVKPIKRKRVPIEVKPIEREKIPIEVKPIEREKIPIEVKPIEREKIPIEVKPVERRPPQIKVLSEGVTLNRQGYDSPSRKPQSTSLPMVINQLQFAIAQNNVQEVKTGFHRLESVMGSDSLFLVKMRGYWSLKRGKLEEAGRYFNKVLSLKPQDMDAQLNMVIVEMRSNYQEAAKERLEKLVKRYPMDDRVLALIQKLK